MIPKGAEKLLELNEGREYIAISTPLKEGNWRGSCDLHWVDTADERGYEEVLQVLERSGFDDVLDEIGQYFQSESLAVTGVGFMLATQRHGPWRADS
jgi:hypothetical protein